MGSKDARALAERLAQEQRERQMWLLAADLRRRRGDPMPGTEASRLPPDATETLELPSASCQESTA